jgi:hypothetical protein
MLKMFAMMALALGVGAALAPAGAQQYVNGYYKSNGTYVQGYYRSTPDGDPSNNYSTRGNINPYTGQVGTRDPSPALGGGYLSLGGNPNGLGGDPNGIYNSGGSCLGTFC